MILIYLIMLCCATFVENLGVMLLYRPRDISKECALSRYLRYDLSYGMGMSDTITLVFRTLFNVDYECIVDIVSDSDLMTLIIVIRYPSAVGVNCEVNSNGITVLMKDSCFRLCDYAEERYSRRIIFPVKSRLRFRFLSNSSINMDMNAYMYQVTATTARKTKRNRDCYRRNETFCNVEGEDYCFTSGVVCDGVQNCGFDDWLDGSTTDQYLHHVSNNLLSNLLTTNGYMRIMSPSQYLHGLAPGFNKLANNIAYCRAYVKELGQWHIRYVIDRFDERKTICDTPSDKLGYAPVIAVAAALLCALLAASHVLFRCLPPQANSFFIFNANEDNRLCIDPLLKPRENPSPEPERTRDMSLVPVSSSSSSDIAPEGTENINILRNAFQNSKPLENPAKDCETPARRKITMRSMTAKIQDKLRMVTGSLSFSANHPLNTTETKTQNV